MTSATLALSHGFARLPNHLKSLLWSPSTSTLKAFSTFLTIDEEETPAMKALKDIPYPSTSPDPSIFESWSDEYGGISSTRTFSRPVEKLAPTWRTSSHHNPGAVLEKLIAAGKFAEAEAVREELVGMGAPIHHSHVYYSAAWDVLRRRRWPPNRAELFANWLSLLPNNAESKEKTHFHELKSALLFGSTIVDLKSISHFGVILSSKGYIRTVGAPIVASLTRYADPEVCSRVVDEMLAADYDYKRNVLGLTNITDARFKDTSKRLWSIVVRTHCSVKRPMVAVQVAKRVHELGFSLTKYTYQYLVGKLEADGLHKLAAEMRALHGDKSLPVAKSLLATEDFPTSEPTLRISPDLSLAANQDLCLALLKRSSLFGLPAHATDLIPYFDIYKNGVRGGEAVIKLRSRAYQISPAAVSAVLLAELLHHHRRGQFTHVLWIFEKFLHVVGVPAVEVTRRLWRRDDSASRKRLQYWSLPPHITESAFNLPTKLWPTPFHTSIVWTALVQLCDSEEEVFVLYDQLLQRSAGQSLRQQGSPFHPISVSGQGDFSHADQYDAAHFRPFLVANTLLRGTTQGLRVFDDMQERGIAPSPQILGTSAALQARHGEPEMALRMLEIMQEVLEKGEPAGSGSELLARDTDANLDLDPSLVRHRTPARVAKKNLLIAHTAVLRGLVDRRAIKPARLVAGMLRDKFGYNIDGGGAAAGGNPRTDAVLRFLRRQEMEGPRARPDPADMAILGRPVDDRQQAHSYYPFLRRDSQVIKDLSAFPGSK